MQIGQSAAPRRANQGHRARRATSTISILPGMLHGATVRSPSPRGGIRDIRFDPGIPWDEFTIVTRRRHPRSNIIALINEDQPYLRRWPVNHAEEPDPAAGASGSRPARRSAAQRHDRDRSAARRLLPSRTRWPAREIIWGADNVFKTLRVIARRRGRRVRERRRADRRGRVRDRARRNSSTSSRTA